jgi:hypothetical protein
MKDHEDPGEARLLLPLNSAGKRTGHPQSRLLVVFKDGKTDAAFVTQTFRFLAENTESQSDVASKRLLPLND